MQQHNYDNAKKDYFEAAEIADRSEEAGLIGGAYGNLAAAYNALGDHFKALKLYNKALELAHKDANVSQLVKWYTNRGDIQTRLGDLGSALADTQKARECLNAVPPHNGIEMTQLRAIIRCQDGVIYYLRGQVRDALIAHQEVLPTAQKLNDKRLEVRSCSNIGGCYTALHASEGENWLNRALNLCSTSPSLAELAPSVHYFLAEWFLNKSECDLQRAQQHIYNGLEQAQQYNDLIYQHRCLTLLSELVLLQNNAAEAASFLDDAVAMQSIPSLYIAPAVTLRGIAYLLISHHEEAVNAFNDAKSLTKPMCDATVPPLLALHTYVTAWCGLACCGVTAAGDALEAMLARTWNQTTEHKLAANRLVRWLTLVQQIDTYKCLTPFHMHFTVSGSSREE
jgi:tetratricopeptide (TPR) repeat protein